jgi:hypothetical protein
VVYVYAITEREAEVPEVPGFEGAPLRAVRTGAVAAIVSDLDELVQPSERTLWEHESVVEELMVGSALLPMRFGSTLADEEAVTAMLRAREELLVRGLVRVRGAVELGVRALWESDDEPATDEPTAVGAGGAKAEPAASGAGTTYLMRRLGRSRRSDALAEQIHTPLDRLARAGTHRVLSVPRLLLTAAYLVDEDRIEDFRAAVEELDQQIEEAAILCTGPWPPYSFAPAEGAS